MVIADKRAESSDLRRHLAHAREGDPEAFCLLAQAHEARLFGQAGALCRDDGAAEDLLVETMVEAWKSLRNYHETCRFSTWLYSILLHRYQKSVRRAASRPISLAWLPFFEAEQRVEAQRHLVMADISPGEEAAQSETTAQLREAIEALPAKHRQVILLRFFEDASLRDIAVVLGCSVGTVKSRLHHALQKLRRMKIVMNLSWLGRDT
jgi:RNA polymerase sigma-70 factor (ECF subfamily)